MDALPLSAADFAILAVILISALLAFARGLVRETLSVAAWVGAIFATLYGFDYLRPWVQKGITVPLIANVVTGVTLFVGTLVVLSLLSRMISGRLRDSGLSALDRSLGFLFGLARGAVLVCLAYLLFVWVIGPGEHPEWMRSARTMPLVERGAEALRVLVPEEARRESGAVAEEMRRDAEEALEAERLMQSLTSPAPKSDAPQEKGGYNPSERREMDRLIQSEQQ